MAAPCGAPCKLYVSVLAGRSASVACAVNVSSVCSSTVLSAIGASTGAWLTSLTVTCTVWLALSAGVLLSVTTTSNEYTPGPCASLGVQVKTPVFGLMAAPGGIVPFRLKVSPDGGVSASVAVAVKGKTCCSSTGLFAIG